MNAFSGSAYHNNNKIEMKRHDSENLPIKMKCLRKLASQSFR